MIPLLVTGAVSLAGNLIDAWKARSDTTAATQAIQSADFQQSLNAAVKQATATDEAQKQQALPGELQSVTTEILNSPDVRSMARYSSTSSLNLNFNSNGDVFATTSTGKLRQIMVNTDIRQQLQQINSTMQTMSSTARPASNGSMGTAAAARTAHMNGEIASLKLPVELNLTAI
jgi:hypothetical protein